MLYQQKARSQERAFLLVRDETKLRVACPFWPCSIFLSRIPM